MATVEFRQASRIYDPSRPPAVSRISLDIADGEFLVLVGPSGCGKSTTLRMLAGLEPVDEGQIFIDGRDVTETRPRDRDVAMVFQSYALYPHMTVRKNMSFALDLAGADKQEVARKIEAAARTLELEPLLERKPRQLSGGQRQRVAMGRAIVRQPKVFLFDEPLSNLDAKLRIAMRVEIRKLQRRLNTTSIYVTHDQLEAMTLADILVVMNGGQVEQIGNPLQIYQKPATTFVASFIGAPPMNLMPLRSEELTSQIAGVDGAGIVGIRPEDFVISNETAPGGVALGLTVEAIEHVGAEMQLRQDAKGGAGKRHAVAVVVDEGEQDPGRRPDHRHRRLVQAHIQGPDGQQQVQRTHADVGADRTPRAVSTLQLLRRSRHPALPLRVSVSHCPAPRRNWSPARRYSRSSGRPRRCCLPPAATAADRGYACRRWGQHRAACAASG